MRNGFMHILEKQFIAVLFSYKKKVMLQVVKSLRLFRAIMEFHVLHTYMSELFQCHVIPRGFIAIVSNINLK